MRVDDVGRWSAGWTAVLRLRLPEVVLGDSEVDGHGLHGRWAVGGAVGVFGVRVVCAYLPLESGGHVHPDKQTLPAIL